MEGIEVYQPGDFDFGPGLAINACHAIWGIGKRKAHLLVETEDANEATHWTSDRHNREGDAHICLGYKHDFIGGRHVNHKPWYTLVPITPVEPTPEEIAAAEKEAAWKEYRDGFKAKVSDDGFLRDSWSAGYDARAALDAK